MSRSKFAILASTALSLGLVQSASAQSFTWTGFYYGVNFGSGFGHGTGEANVPAFSTSIGGVAFPFPGGTSSFSMPARDIGALAGAQYGYNFQFAPGWLAGFEHDVQWSRLKNNGNGVFSGAFTTGCGATTCLFTNITDLTATLNWFSTARGRIGTVIWNNVVIYATGGAAVGGVSVKGFNNLNLEQQSSGATTTLVTPININQTKFGWAGGWGFEGKIPNSNATWRVEFLHLDFGSVSGAFGSNPNVIINSVKVQEEIVRLAFNYQFSAVSVP
jgi:outer membrane immunogenic protein